MGRAAGGGLLAGDDQAGLEISEGLAAARDAGAQAGAIKLSASCVGCRQAGLRGAEQSRARGCAGAAWGQVGHGGVLVRRGSPGPA
jgi:hypothetical protein